MTQYTRSTCKILSTSQVSPTQATVNVEAPIIGTLVYDFSRSPGKSGADLAMVSMASRPGQRVPYRDGYSAARRVAILAMDEAKRTNAERWERIRHEAALRRAGGVPAYIKAEEK